MCSPERPECVQELGEAALVLRRHLECLLPVGGAAESNKAAEGDHRALAKAKKARESRRSNRDLKALELKLAEC